MQNEPNYKYNQMSITIDITRYYENLQPFGRHKNKANLSPREANLPAGGEGILFLDDIRLRYVEQ